MSSICVKQRVEKNGGGLYSPHNLHRTDHISKDEDVKRNSILLPRTGRYAMLILKTCAMRELRSFFVKKKTNKTRAPFLLEMLLSLEIVRFRVKMH